MADGLLAVLKKRLEQEISDDVDDTFDLPTPQIDPKFREVLSNPKVQQILQWFLEDQLLIEPTLRRVAQVRAEIQKAKLDVLFSPEEQADLLKSLKGSK